MTLVSELTDLLGRVEDLRDGNRGADAGREFAIAATSLEDSIMRINRGFAKAKNSFKVADVEAGNATS